MKIKIVKYLIIFLLLVLLFSCSDSPSNNGKVELLTVGIEYNGSLDGPVKDALEIGKCLEEIYNKNNIPFKKTSMLSHKYYSDGVLFPNRENILSYLSSISLSEKDLFILYISSHGGYIGDEGYVILGKESRESGKVTTISFSELSAILSSLPSSVLLILDLCSSGGFTPPSSSLPQSLPDAFSNVFKVEKNSILALCGTTDLKSFCYEDDIYIDEGEEERHGLLTLSLLFSLGWEHTKSVENLAIVDGVEEKYYGTLNDERIKSHFSLQEEFPSLDEFCKFYDEREEIKLTDSKYEMFLY